MSVYIKIFRPELTAELNSEEKIKKWLKLNFSIIDPIEACLINLELESKVMKSKEFIVKLDKLKIKEFKFVQVQFIQYLKSYTYYNIIEYQKCIDTLNQILKVSKDQLPIYFEFSIYCALESTYNNLENYFESLKCNLKSIELVKSNPNSEINLSSIYLRIFSLHLNLESYADAKILIKEIKVKDLTANETLVYYYYLGNLFNLTNEYKKAIKNYNIALNKIKISNRKDLHSIIELSIAQLLIKSKDFKSANDLLEKIISNKTIINKYLNLALLEMSLCLLMLNKSPKALEIFYRIDVNTIINSREYKKYMYLKLLLKNPSIIKDIEDYDEACDKYLEIRIENNVQKQLYSNENIQLTYEIDTLKKIDEFKSTFFSNITHELRTPLSLIINPLDVTLREDTALQPKTMKNIQTALNNSKRQLQLVNQLLDINKLEFKSYEIENLNGNIQEFISFFIDYFQEAAATKNINLKVENKLPNQVFAFDDKAIEKIFGNLISNAIKFTPENGTINIKILLTSENKIEFNITDSGIGISDEQLPRIFDRFYQADQSSVKKYAGTGIGLAIVKEMTELLSGHIEVESKLKKGTSFRVTIPIQNPIHSVESKSWKANEVDWYLGYNESKPMSIKKEMKDSDSNKSLLIVEDNHELREFLVSQFQTEYKVFEARNGLEGLKLAKKELPDIILSDIRMPEMDGIEMTRQLQADMMTTHIPILILTANADDKSVIQSINDGAVDYLTKPFNLDILKAKIDRVLSLRVKILQKNLTDFKYGYGETIRPVSQNTKFIDDFSQYIQDNISSELDLMKVSKHYRMSESNMRRKILKEFNLNFGELIINYRVHYAKNLMIHQPEFNLKEIAFKSGFKDTSHFTRVFKKSFDINPSQFQFQLKSKSE
jgi:signal transduction histidine kinase/CheY-like chemotaxis protein/AraC-like DNA-binding protein